MAITYSISGGVDAALFKINASTGVLEFKVAPDFEKPGDANKDNVYEVTVAATDADGTTTQAMHVTVTDVGEGQPPRITSAPVASIPENTTSVGTVTAEDPDAVTPPIDPPPTGDGTDGSANAPTGTPQLATLLDGLAHKPPWKVAGVHYRVGIKTGVALKNPSTLSMTGVTINGRNCTVTGNNVTIDGYDFGSGGPWFVQINGSNAKFTNCKFLGGNSQGPSGGAMVYINTHPAAGQPGSYFGYCDFDGAADTGFVINYTSEGDHVIEYCWIHNGGSDLVSVADYYNSGRLSKFTARFNVWQNSGMKPGHPDWVQVYGGSIATIDVHHNLGTQNASGQGTQGWIWDATDGGTFAFNTMLCRNGGAVSYYVSTTGGKPVQFHDNYIDLAGAIGFAYPGVVGATYTNNVNMVTGGSVPGPS